MNKSVLLCAVSCFALAVSIVPVQGESQGKPLTEEQLLERSTLIFVGEVLEVKGFAAYKRTVPIRSRVLLSLKGKVESGERDVLPKYPGKFAYFDQEFTPAVKGNRGVFYLGKDGQLIGFRRF